MGLRVPGLGCRVIGFRCQGLGLGCEGLGFRVWTSMMRIKGLYEVDVIYGSGGCIIEGSCGVSVAVSIGCQFLWRHSLNKHGLHKDICIYIKIYDVPRVVYGDLIRICENNPTWASIRFR